MNDMQRFVFRKALGSVDGDYRIEDEMLSVCVERDSDHAYVEFVLDFPVDGSEYVLFPACCYNGNRFKSVRRAYPPMFTAEEAAEDMPVTITDVIRLNEDGSGKIEVTTGDVSVPCIGVFDRKNKRGLLLFTIQQIGGVNLGLSYEKGKIGLSYPHMRREKIYRWPYMQERSDEGMSFWTGQTLEIPYNLLDFPCGSMEEFYEVFFKNRKIMGMDAERPEILPFDRQFEIQKNKFNQMNWQPGAEFYRTVPFGDACLAWQPGWVGGGMSGFALMKLGGETEWERGMATLRHLFRTQAPCGLFYEGTDENGTFVYTPGALNLLLIRKSADMLLFLIKYFRLFEERNVAVPAEFLSGTRKLADAFVSLWDKYHQFGQFIDADTGRIIAGGSTSGAIASAGLAEAYRYFGTGRYLEVAVESAQQYYFCDALNGYTTGGPGEILQGPDSESAFGLLESFVTLLEVTEDPIWLKRAEFMLHQCSSWVVSYNYRFPDGSEFARLGMKTVGSVFANVQNKHSAPGICTLSGDSILKLYRRTGKKEYLELLKDISLTISQYMSTDERPIYSWDVPKDASLLNDDSIRAEREKLPQGFICERVNLSDWESARCIGGVFNGSCWCETSNLLMLAEVAPYLNENGEERI